MKTYKYGNINSWLEQGERYEHLNEAWWQCMCVSPQFLYVYEDNELILVLEVLERVTTKIQGLLGEKGWYTGLDMYTEAALELLEEAGMVPLVNVSG